MSTNLDQLTALKKSYLSTFSSESGKKVLADLERKCFGRGTTFNENPQRLAFNEGQRSIYLSIKNMMVLDIERLKKLNEQKPKED